MSVDQYMLGVLRSTPRGCFKEWPNINYVLKYSVYVRTAVNSRQALERYAVSRWNNPIIRERPTGTLLTFLRVGVFFFLLVALSPVERARAAP